MRLLRDAYKRRYAAVVLHVELMVGTLRFAHPTLATTAAAATPPLMRLIPIPPLTQFHQQRHRQLRHAIHQSRQLPPN